MADPIKAGDMVRLVWACCAKGRRHLGWVGTVEAVETYPASTCFCGYTTIGVHAWIDIGGSGVVPLSWLIRIDPEPVLDDVRKDEEITA